MGNDDAPLKEHSRPIPQDELIPEAPEDDQTDDIRRLWPMVQWGPRALMTLPRAQTTAESTVAQFRALESFPSGGISCRSAFRSSESTCCGTKNKEGGKSDRTAPGSRQHLGGLGQDRRRHRQPHGLRGLAVDDQLEGGGRLD